MKDDEKKLNFRILKQEEDDQEMKASVKKTISFSANSINTPQQQQVYHVFIGGKDKDESPLKISKVKTFRDQAGPKSFKNLSKNNSIKRKE